MLFIRKTSQANLRGFFLISAFLLFFSCAVVSSDGARETPISLFRTAAAVEPAWQSFADGIVSFQGRVSVPQLEFWAVRIDLASPNTHIVVRGGAANETGILSTRVSSFVRDNNLAAGINAVPFDVITSREGQPIRNMGVIISDGRLISSINPHYDALVFFTDGKAAILRQSVIQSTENIENAIGGFHQILTGGKPAERTLNRTERHPRSAAGISANGKYLILLVIDGRRTGSTGGTERETAVLLHSLGSWDGINFDGGGSSTLALRYPDGNVRVVNTPVHGGIPGMERAVAGCLGIYIKD
jgi:exopolysaccharide biosynthesis protein